MASLPGLIDTHLHVGRLYADDSEGLPPERLLAFMDFSGVERAVLLPAESPECVDHLVTTEYVVDVCRRRPERFIPFCNVDPRESDVESRLRQWRDAGCLGYGEAMSGLWIDDPRLRTIYHVCGELHMPVLFDIDVDMNLDETHLPRFERMLAEHPDTIFIGHGPMFWAEISGDFTRESGVRYPRGPIRPDGAVCRLLTDYPNLHADLSAGSSLNALTRDEPFGLRFLDEFQDKLLFGTDLCHSRHLDRRPGIIDVLESAAASGDVSPGALAKICRTNAIGLLNLDE